MGRGSEVTVMDAQKVKLFGAALVLARQAVKLTQSQLSTAAGVPQSTLSVWERGEAEPSPDAVFALEEALAVDAGSLSRILGYAPVDAELTASVETAILADPVLDLYRRKLLLQIYRSMVGE